MKKSGSEEERESSIRASNEGDRTSDEMTGEDNTESNREDSSRSRDTENNSSSTCIQLERSDRKLKQMEDKKNSGSSMKASSSADASHDERYARKLQQMNEQESTECADHAGIDHLEEIVAAPGDALAASRLNEKEDLMERAVPQDLQGEQEFSKALDAGAAAEATAAAGAAVAATATPKREVPRLTSDLEAPPISAGVDEDGIARPGAYAAPGRAFGAFPVWGRARRQSRSSSRSLTRAYDRVSSRFDRREPCAVEVNAVLVEDEAVEHGSSGIPSSSQGDLVAADASAPIVEATRIEPEEKINRRWLYLFSLAVLVVIATTVAVVVPLSISDSDSGDGRRGSGDSQGSGDSDDGRPRPPTMPPEVFDMTVVTAVLQLDDRPFETSWSLECGGESLFDIPFNTYTGAENRLVTTRHEAPVGTECELIVEDSGGNGIQGGKVELYHGGNITDESALIQRGDGNFNSIQSFQFVIEPRVSAATPTAAPTSVISIEGGVFITVQVQLDRFPTETGWVLVCDDVTLANVPALTYTEPNGMLSETFSVRRGASCLYNLTDEFEDGICCGLGEGFYNILYSDDENTNVRLAAGGDFGGDVSIPFVAAPLIQVNVGIELFGKAMQTGWDLTCNGTVLEAVPIGTYTRDSEEIFKFYFVDAGTDCVFRIQDDAFEFDEDDEEFGAFTISLGGAGNWPLAAGYFGSFATFPFVASLAPPPPQTAVGVDIRLDMNPMQTGWSLICEDGTNRTVPTGTYTQQFQSISEFFLLNDSTFCVFRIDDAGGDGLGDGGGYDPDDGDGDPLDGGGFEVYTFRLPFEMVEDDYDDEDFFFNVASPGEPGTPLDFRTAMTTTLRAFPRARAPKVLVIVEIALDNDPIETGWNLTCEEEISRIAPFGTYTAASPRVVRETFVMKDNTGCVFRIQDAGGDGFSGEGSYTVKYGDGEEDSEISFVTVAADNSSNGPFEEEEFSFTASLRGNDQTYRPHFRSDM